MNWRKKQNTVQKRGIFMDIVDVISDVVDIVAEENVIADTSCSDDDANNNNNTTNGNGFFGGTSFGGTSNGSANNGAGLIGSTTDLTITINEDTDNIKIPFTQKTNSNSNFIHIMESNIENNNYQARFGILTQVPSLNNSTDYSLILYDNNRNVIVHADKISVPTIPQQKQYGYQIIATQNNSNTFNVYQTETCTITISDKKSSS
jgi:hypothetical protein